MGWGPRLPLVRCPQALSPVLTRPGVPQPTLGTVLRAHGTAHTSLTTVCLHPPSIQVTRPPLGPTGEFPTGARGLQTSRCWNRSPWKGRWPAPQLSPEGLSAGDGHVPALPTGTGSVEEVTLPALLWGGQREGSAMWGEEARPGRPSHGLCSPEDPGEAAPHPLPS